jgi:hypothetical protein
MSKPTQNMSMDEFIKLRNKIARLEKILVSQKQMQVVVERPIRPESDQRRHIDISSTDTSGNSLPGGHISEGDPWNYLVFPSLKIEISVKIPTTGNDPKCGNNDLPEQVSNYKAKSQVF